MKHNAIKMPLSLGRKRTFFAAVRAISFLLAVLFGLTTFADWTSLGNVNGVRVYRDNSTGKEWTTTLGKVASSDRGSSARGLVARHGFRLPSFGELQQMQRNGGFSYLNIRNSLGNYYETSNPNYLANAAVNGFQTPQERKGTGQNWVIGVRNPRPTEIVVVQPEVVTTTTNEIPQSVSVTAISTTNSNVTVTSSDGTPETEEVSTRLPNPISGSVEVLPAASLKAFRKDIEEDMILQIERIRDALSQDDLSPETLSAQLKEAGATKEQLNELLLALENEEFSAISRIWVTSGGDPVKAAGISRTLSLLANLESLESAVEEQEISTTDLRSFRRTFDKSKPGKETEKIVKKCLESLNSYIGLSERINDRTKQKLPESMVAPIDEVTVVLHPKWSENTVMALEEDVFIVGAKSSDRKKKKVGDEEDEPTMEIVEASLDSWLPRLPMSEAAPIITETFSNRWILHNVGSEDIVFALAGARKTLSPGQTGSYDFPESGSISVSVTKTRAVSSGRRRGGTTQQSYSETQTVPVAVGTVYDGKSVSGTLELTARSNRVTVDNSSNPRPFHCEIDDQPFTIPAGETMTTEETTGPVVVSFARSDDPNDLVSYEFTETTTCKPAVSAADGKWALFQENAVVE